MVDPSERGAAAMDLFDDLPVVQAVTEMDVPTGTPVTEDVLRRQGSFYKSAFDIFRKQQAENKNIFSVTVWGLADEKSWRSCSGAPLVFDDDYDGKWAYAGILGLDIPKESQTLTVFGAADALDPASQTWEFMPETRISDEASFQARWNDKRVVVRVRAEDVDVQATDAVKLTTADGSFRIPRSGGAVDGRSGPGSRHAGCCSGTARARRIHRPRCDEAGCEGSGFPGLISADTSLPLAFQ